MRHLLPVYLGCNVSDVRSKAEIKSSAFDRPSLFLFDTTPGGVGLAERIYELWPMMLSAARDALARCVCSHGCPACIGPSPRTGGVLAKDLAGRILERCSSPS
ncbi:MAG: Zn-binding domain-containing protein [Planctomycetota bacterium]|jgi:DEAD/DEAH box helicase domain-containing protein